MFKNSELEKVIADGRQQQELINIEMACSDYAAKINVLLMKMLWKLLMH